jgi:choline-glycine betaine transporter
MVLDGKIQVLDVPMRDVTFALGSSGQHISFNPLTSLIGIIALWGLAIWCMVDPDDAKDVLSTARSNVSLMFSWLIIGQKPVSLFFVLFIAYKFGDVKFGGKHEKPQFDGAQFFSMIL